MTYVKQASVAVVLNVALALVLPARAPAKLRIFVSNSSDGTVSVVDGNLDREEAVIRVGNFPQGLAIRERPTPLLAVANSRGNSVTLLDPVNLTKVGDDIAVGRFPIDMQFSADGGQLFCGCDTDQTITVVDVQTRTTIGAPIAIGGSPRRPKLSPDGNFLYVAKYEEAGAVVVVDTRSRQVVQTIPVGAFPTDVVLQPDGKRLFAASFNTSTVGVIDLSTLAVIDTLAMSTGYGLLVHPTRPLLYSLATMDDEVQVMDYAARREVATVAVGQKPTYSAITPDGRFVYVVNGTDGNVMKLDTETNTVLMRIAVGVEPSDALVFEVPSGLSRGVVYGAAGIGLLVLAGATMLFRRRRKASQG